MTDRFLDALSGTIVDGVVEKLREIVPESVTGMRPRLLDVKQAAKYLGRSEHSIRHMMSKGKIRSVRDGKRRFLDIRELDRWIDANTEGSEG